MATENPTSKHRGYAMKVQDLISRLSLCPQQSEVRFFVAWGDLRTVAEVSPENADGFVVLGEVDLPDEQFARDFKGD